MANIDTTTTTSALGSTSGQIVPPAKRVEHMVVLFNDLVDSTVHLVRLGDEAYTWMLDLLDAERTRLIAEHGGRLVNLAGDGAMITFDATDDAVAFAAAYNDTCTQIGVESRTGIHVGDVMVRSNGDLAGLAIHLAARIESAAPAGGVLLSRSAAERSSAHLAAHGTKDLKGIPEPTDLFLVADAQTAQAA